MAGIVSEFAGTISDVFDPASDFGTESPLSDAPPLVISERTGDKRVLALRGRALPYRPVEFSGSQRVSMTDYPGNATQSAQVLGAKEEPTTIGGIWKDRYLGRGAEQEASAIVDDGSDGIFSAMELVRLVDNIRRKGQLLRVQWDAVSRDGFLTKFSFSPSNRHDIAWSMTFDWINQSEDAAAPSVAGAPSLEDTRGSWLDQLEGLLDDVQAPFALVDGVATAIDQQVRRATEAINMIADTGTGILGTIQSAANSLQHVVGLLDTLQSAGNELVAALENLTGSDASFSWQSTVRETDDEGTLAPLPAVNTVGSAGASATFGQQIQAERYRRRLIRRGRSMRHQAARQLQEAIARLDPELLAVFIAPALLDYRSVSTTYYGTPDEWWRLQRTNNSATSLVPAGTVIFVPRLAMLQSRFDRRFEPSVPASP